MYSKTELEYLLQVKEKLVSSMTRHSGVSVDNANIGRIISLSDFMNNVDKSEKVLYEKIFIIVYFFYLKYYENLCFNENDLFFVEDYKFPWKFRLEMSDKKYYSSNSLFNPWIFTYIYNNIRLDGLEHPFLKHIRSGIYEFLYFDNNICNRKFLKQKTQAFLDKYDNDLKKVFNLIIPFKSIAAYF